MRTDLIKYMYQKYPERIPNSVLQRDRKNPPTVPEREIVSVEPQQILEQNLCPLMTMIDQDFAWDGTKQDFQGASYNGGSEPAFNTQFALADSIVGVGEQDGSILMNDAFWTEMSLDFNLGTQP